MTISFLANYLAGEFENGKQALAEPIWYVHLRLWLRPLPDFWDDSFTFFAEQANIVNLDQPYRPRLLRLRQTPDLVVEHYMVKNIYAVQGGGSNPEKLKDLKAEDVQFLPKCTLKVESTQLTSNNYLFKAFPQTEQLCEFEYEGSNYQVVLGFQVDDQELLTYDKGINPTTGKAIWGAILGPYRFQKIKQFNF